MREHLYRAQRVDTKEWVCGVPYAEYMICGMTTAYYDDEVPMSKYTEFDYVEVIPETVCEAVGRKDKNQNQIFEHDKVKCKNYHGEVEGIIEYFNGYFYLSCTSGYSDEYLFNCSDIEVIGTIFDEGGAAQ